VKNIALAIQMYFADNNDRFPPGEHRQEVYDYFAAAPGGADECRLGTEGERVQWMVNLANPYVQWPVVLDEHVKNRDVWNCPSAKMTTGASFILPMQDWLGYLQANEGSWGAVADVIGPCLHMTFPPGWGGEVTDSILQQRRAGALFWRISGTNVRDTFTQTIGTGQQNYYDAKLVSFEDVARLPVVADGGTKPNFLSIATMAYPDICCPECAGVAWYGSGWPTEECPDGSVCPDCPPLHAVYRHLREGPYKWKKDAARHLGGTNIGWADGHASWVNSQRLCAMSDDEEIEGVGLICGELSTSVEAFLENCGEPPEGTDFLFSRKTDWEGN
jgi:prepilin-type processing-associated H-X9-DG protein